MLKSCKKTQNYNKNDQNSHKRIKWLKYRKEQTFIKEISKRARTVGHWVKIILVFCNMGLCLGNASLDHPVAFSYQAFCLIYKMYSFGESSPLCDNVTHHCFLSFVSHQQVLSYSLQTIVNQRAVFMNDILEKEKITRLWHVGCC